MHITRSASARTASDTPNSEMIRVRISSTPPPMTIENTTLSSRCRRAQSFARSVSPRPMKLPIITAQEEHMPRITTLVRSSIDLTTVIAA